MDGEEDRENIMKGGWGEKENQWLSYKKKNLFIFLNFFKFMFEKSKVKCIYIYIVYIWMYMDV